MKRLFILFLFLTSNALSETAAQSDWSGGPGTQGPVTTWGSSYSSGESIEELDPGNLSLQLGFSANPVILGLMGGMGLSPCWGDIDQDGDIDMVKVNTALDSLIWMSNPGDPTLPWTRNHIARVPGIRSMDTAMPQYSIVELNYAEGNLSRVSYYIRSGSGSWSFVYLGELGDSDYPTGVRAADVDGNGITDVIGWMFAFDEVRVWWDHSPTQMETIISPHCPTDIFAFDGDGDGDSELAVDRSWYPETDVYWNYGTGWVPAMLPEIYYCMGLDAADVDEDGISELLAIAYNEAYLCDLYEGSWHIQLICSGVQSGRFVEFSGDGTADVAAVMGEQLTLLHNIGSGAAWDLSTVSLGFSCNRVYCSDFDFDTNPDPVVISTGTGKSAWIDIERQHDPEGWLESSILYVGCDPEWDEINWDADTPAGTDISFQVRSSDDFTDMGSWSDAIPAPGTLSGILDTNDSYVQYRVFMSTDDPLVSPVLHEVGVSWNPVGTEGEGLPCALGLLPVSPNPATGAVGIDFTVPDVTSVRFELFDITGRLVRSVEPAMYGTGRHSVLFDETVPGVYIVRMLAGRFSQARRFVVLD